MENKIDLAKAQEEKKEVVQQTVKKARTGLKKGWGYTTSDPVHKMLLEYARFNGFMRGDRPNANAALEYMIRSEHERMIRLAKAKEEK